MSYKKSNWVPYDPTLSFEQNVTQGGTTTADKLNNMETGIGNAFDKTSDTIGTRNYALGTSNSIPMKSDGNTGTTIQSFPLSDRLASLPANTSIHYSYDLLVTGADGGIHWAGWGNPWNAFIQNQVISSDGTHHFEGNTTLPSNEIITGNIFYLTIDKSLATYQIENLIITVGSTHVDYLPAPEDKADDSKVVHTADMRKSPSDVAGIEEVNAKQDKLTITPADDSKVVHNSGNETIGDTKTFTNPIKGTIDGITYRYSAQGDDLNTSYMNDSVILVGGNSVANAPAGTSGIWAIVRNYNSNATNGAQSYYDTNTGVLYVRTRNSTSTFTPWIQVADDSKVAHLSGANNFDTVPTVNNNPVATTDDVTTASNTVLTSANTSISKLLQSSSSNDEDSAVTNSTSDTSNFYYWTE